MPIRFHFIKKYIVVKVDNFVNNNEFGVYDSNIVENKPTVVSGIKNHKEYVDLVKEPPPSLVLVC